MTLTNALGLLGAMIVLAMTPDTSVIVVVARSLSYGFWHGFVTVLGLLSGDFVWIIVAVFGLNAIAQSMTPLLLVLKYFAGAYLIYLGIQIFRTKASQIKIEKASKLSLLSNFLSGLLITISDVKAVLFYLSFLPAFLDLDDISIAEIGIILLNATIAVGGVKLVYAYTANKARLLLQSTKTNRVINLIAGMTIIATGIFLLIKV